MWSLYVGQKQLSSEHASYVAHHPDLRALLSDFVQHLLVDKPTDVLDFCAQYFDAFSADYVLAEEIAHAGSGFTGSGTASGQSCVESVCPNSRSGNDVQGTHESKTSQPSQASLMGSEDQHALQFKSSMKKSDVSL